MKNPEKLATAIIAVMGGTAAVGIGAVTPEFYDAYVNPRPKIELSDKPDKLVFNSKTERQIAKGILEARQKCRVKDVIFEQQEWGITRVTAECEPGTLQTVKVIAPTSAEKSR